MLLKLFYSLDIDCIYFFHSIDFFEKNAFQIECIYPNYIKFNHVDEFYEKIQFMFQNPIKNLMFRLLNGTDVKMFPISFSLRDYL